LPRKEDFAEEKAAFAENICGKGVFPLPLQRNWLFFEERVLA